MRLGTGEILIILVVVLLVFGPNKLPQLGDALGRGIRNFKRASEPDATASPEAHAPAALPRETTDSKMAVEPPKAVEIVGA
jgi:sec-independent protein translocase protein TatA